MTKPKDRTYKFYQAAEEKLVGSFDRRGFIFIQGVDRVVWGALIPHYYGIRLLFPEDMPLPQAGDDPHPAWDNWVGVPKS